MCFACSKVQIWRLSQYKPSGAHLHPRPRRQGQVNKTHETYFSCAPRDEVVFFVCKQQWELDARCQALAAWAWGSDSCSCDFVGGCPSSWVGDLFFKCKCATGHPFFAFLSIWGHPFSETWEWRGIRFRKRGIR